MYKRSKYSCIINPEATNPMINPQFQLRSFSEYANRDIGDNQPHEHQPKLFDG